MRIIDRTSDRLDANIGHAPSEVESDAYRSGVAQINRVVSYRSATNTIARLYATAPKNRHTNAEIEADAQKPSIAKATAVAQPPIATQQKAASWISVRDGFMGHTGDPRRRRAEAAYVCAEEKPVDSVDRIGCDYIKVGITAAVNGSSV